MAEYLTKFNDLYYLTFHTKNDIDNIKKLLYNNAEFYLVRKYNELI